MRIGSLCSGYGGLDCGLQQVVGGEVAWHVENDPAPSKILAHHWPAVPNYGDITTVDWTQVEPVDWLTAGFPCQDLSHAGKRAGIKPGNRSGLWFHVAYAISQLRPPNVLIENVRGLLSGRADRSVESDDTDLGDAPVDAGRAIGVVLGDLADLGYDATWTVVRASDAGAPHGRARIFVVAEHADASGRDTDASQRPGETGLLRDDPRSTGDVAADAAGSGWRAEGQQRGLGAAERVSDLAADTDGIRRERAGTTRDGRRGPTDHATSDARMGGPSRGADVCRRQPDIAWSGHTPTDPDLAGGETLLRRPGAGEPRRLQPVERGDTDWGAYEPAIRRWEHVTGRAAPRPTEPGRTGPRLAPLFVEWLMGLPEGHVTAVGLPRNAQLKALGNGVVPAQCALAVRTLLPLIDLAIAA